MTVQLLLPEERPLHVASRIEYDTADPMAVRIRFYADEASEVEWVFARDLLVEGRLRACGDGDVRIWPLTGRAAGWICLRLTVPTGDALIGAPVDAVERFVRASLALVPQGRELDTLDLDARLVDFFRADPDNPDGPDHPDRRPGED